MRFPGQRKRKHYFPADTNKRENAIEDIVKTERTYIVGIDQLLVDIECSVTEEFLKKEGLAKGESQILPDEQAGRIYDELVAEGRVIGEYAGGSVGNTLHNYSMLSDSKSVLLGAIKKAINVGDYAFKYIRQTSARVDLNYLQPCPKAMGRAICFVTPDKERTFGISKGCMNDWSEKYVPEDLVKNAGLLLLTAYLLRDENSPIFKATVKACDIALAAGVPIVFTLGTSLLISEKRDFFKEFIRKYVTVAAMNETEAAAVTGIADPLLSSEKILDIADLVLITVGAKGLYLSGWVDKKFARQTESELHTKAIADYNINEFSRPMLRLDCEEPIKIYTHINPYLGGPDVIQSTNGAGDAALSALLHDMSALCYFKTRYPNSDKLRVRALTYSSLSQIARYANRVSFEVLTYNTPRLTHCLPEKEADLEDSYWSDYISK